MIKTPKNNVINQWDKAGNFSISAGHKINKPEILFKKIEDEIINKEIDKLKDRSYRKQK